MTSFLDIHLSKKGTLLYITQIACWGQEEMNAEHLVPNNIPKNNSISWKYILLLINVLFAVFTYQNEKI